MRKSIFFILLSIFSLNAKNPMEPLTKNNLSDGISKVRHKILKKKFKITPKRKRKTMALLERIEELEERMDRIDRWMSILPFAVLELDDRCTSIDKKHITLEKYMSSRDSDLTSNITHHKEELSFVKDLCNVQETKISSLGTKVHGQEKDFGFLKEDVKLQTKNFLTLQTNTKNLSKNIMNVQSDVTNIQDNNRVLNKDVFILTKELKTTQNTTKKYNENLEEKISQLSVALVSLQQEKNNRETNFQGFPRYLKNKKRKKQKTNFLKRKNKKNYNKKKLKSKKRKTP